MRIAGAVRPSDGSASLEQLADLQAQLVNGEAQLSAGHPEDLMAFIGCFEPPAERMPLLATR